MKPENVLDLYEMANGVYATPVEGGMKYLYEHRSIELDCYDAGLLGDGGGGDIAWWHDYMRSELARAHDFYQSQLNNNQ